MSLTKIKNDRLKKVASLEKTGIDLYPAEVDRTHTCREAVDNFESLKEKNISLVGRLLAMRGHGGSSFADIEDGAQKIQIFLKKDVLGDKNYSLFTDNFDLGDFIQVSGQLFLTKAGEKTLEVKEYKLLSKSILPLPEKWHGLQDVEERFRKRYLDLLMNKEIKERFIMRSRIIRDLRVFLEKEEFIEVETPILQNLPGGAMAQPFKTHLNALNLDLYLRVSPELYLKRLLVGGLEKVYEIGRCFRNEGMDFSHNPDFTMLEFYWAYADYNDLMQLTERMFDFLVPQMEIEYDGKKINFGGPWRKVSMEELIEEHCHFEVSGVSDEQLKKEARNYGLKIAAKMPRFKIIDEIYKKICRPHLIQPTFVINHPIEMCPLAKKLKDDSTRAARFQLVVGGLELVNAYSELNDPIDQEKRMKEQEAHRQSGETEAHRYDEDFVEALGYGMPPAAGWGMGIDRLMLLLTNSHAVKEVILFPTMRPQK